MKKKLILSMLFSMVSTSIVMAGSLSDISGHKNQQAIQSLYDKGVISGYSDGTYRPNNPVNRAEFVKLLMTNIYGTLNPTSGCFSDVKTEWFAPFVCYAKIQNVVQGYSDGTYRPAQTVNYAEALKIMYNSYSDPAKNLPDTSLWYGKYLTDAEKNSIALSGINPANNLTRGDIAQLLWNYYEKKVNTSTTTPTPTPQIPTTPTPVPSTVPPISAGGEIYVATTGSDSSGNGSISKPYKTVTKAIEVAVSGNKIVLRNGTYKEPGEIRIRVPDITIMSKDGEWGVIEKALPVGPDDYDSAIYFDADAHRGRLSRLEVIGGFYAISTETKWDWGNPKDRKGTSDLIIEKSKIHGSGRDAIKIKPNSDNIQILDNEIYDTGKSETPSDCNAEAIDNVNGDNMIVRGNNIHNICSNGIYAKGGATNALIENNIIENVGGMGIGVGFDTSPEFFDLAVNPNYYENINGIVRNNYISNTGLAGIGLYASKNALVENNTLQNVANGSDHAALYFGVTLQDYDPIAKRPANINPTIRNNIISLSSAITQPDIGIRFANELDGLSALQGGATMSGNCYFQTGKAFSFFDNRPGIEIENGTLAQWKANIKSDNTSIEADPQLGSNKMPASGSLCVGKGYKK